MNKIPFSLIEGGEWFVFNGTTYVKIKPHELNEWGINSINAMNIITTGLTKFNDNEDVIPVRYSINTWIDK